MIWIQFSKSPGDFHVWGFFYRKMVQGFWPGNPYRGNNPWGFLGIFPRQVHLGDFWGSTPFYRKMVQGYFWG